MSSKNLIEIEGKYFIYQPIYRISKTRLYFTFRANNIKLQISNTSVLYFLLWFRHPWTYCNFALLLRTAARFFFRSQSELP